jgi:acyl-CoA synthetase (AMP-forming)/AMP-acid ligase II
MHLNRNLGRLIEVATGREWSRDEIRQQVMRRVAAYRRLGVGRGERVLLQLGNCPEFFADLLAVWHVGGCAVPVDTRLTPFEFERIVHATQARLTIVDDAADPAKAAAAGIEAIHTQEAAGSPAPSAALPSRLRLDDDGLILFTSGSTDRPKGVVHTHRSLLARWTSLKDVLGVGAYERTLCFLPTNFGHGLICNSLFPWLAGCDLYIAPPFKSEIIMRLGDLVDQHRITFLSSVPSAWNLALRVSRPPAGRTLRRIHVGSAPLSAALWAQIREWAGIREVFNVYGITETGSWTAGTTSGEVVPEDGLIGEPWGAALRLCSARTPGEFADCRQCEPGEQGMVWLNTPALMKGYYLQEDLTDAVVSHGWFMTGDIGVIDERGRLYLKGRERDEINKGGVKVFPAEIDLAVQGFPGVADVCAFAVEDHAYGENVAMALVFRGSKIETARKLHEWLKTRLAEYKRPVRWYQLDEIARSDRGKIDRRSVKHICEARQPLNLAALLRGADCDNASQ